MKKETKIFLVQHSKQNLITAKLHRDTLKRELKRLRGAINRDKKLVAKSNQALSLIIGSPCEKSDLEHTLRCEVRKYCRSLVSNQKLVEKTFGDLIQSKQNLKTWNDIVNDLVPYKKKV